MATFQHALVDPFHARVRRIQKQVDNRHLEARITRIANHMASCGKLGHFAKQYGAACGSLSNPFVERSLFLSFVKHN